MQILGVPVQGLSFHIEESCTISVGFVPEQKHEKQELEPLPSFQCRKPVRERNVVLAAMQESSEFESAPTPEHVAQSDDPLVRIPFRVRPEDPPPPTFLTGGFIVLAPRYKSEILQLVLRVPCEVATALQEIEEARDAAKVELFGTIIVAEPQPDPAFAVILAVPDWADNCCCVVIDARQLDDRLFSWILPEYLSRASLLLEYWGLLMPLVCVFIGPVGSWQGKMNAVSIGFGRGPLCRWSRPEVRCRGLVHLSKCSGVVVAGTSLARISAVVMVPACLRCPILKAK